jgi:hypothetical protein
MKLNYWKRGATFWYMFQGHRSVDFMWVKP